MLLLSLRLLSFIRDVLLVRDERYGGFILAPVWHGGVLMLCMRGDVAGSRNSMHSHVMVGGGWAGLFLHRHSDYHSDPEVGAGETMGDGEGSRKFSARRRTSCGPPTRLDCRIANPLCVHHSRFHKTAKVKI